VVEVLYLALLQVLALIVALLALVHHQPLPEVFLLLRQMALCPPPYEKDL
jgi:hypothetical protein